MRILFLDAYFEPEQIAFSHLEKDLLEGLSKAGHEIEIVCPSPTRGVSDELISKYKRIKSETLYNGAVHVTRFYAPRENSYPLLRALRYLWCNYRTYRIGKKVRNIDLVFSNSTPPTQGWISGTVAKKHRVPFIYSLQDIFPDSLITTGLAKKDSILWKVGRKLESVTYQHCTTIVVISEAMKSNLMMKGVAPEKIRIISNWIDTDKVHPVSKSENRLFDEFKISRDKFIVVYAGNFGAAQGAEIVLEAAGKLKEYSDIQFVILGGGSNFQKAIDLSRNLPNVYIHPLMPPERISEVYSMGDIALITCKKGVGKSGMPSKTWSIMSCNTPIIASFDLKSDMDTLLASSRAGKCVEPENVDVLSDEILTCYKARSSTEKKYASGREYVLEHGSKKQCVLQYIAAMRQSYESFNNQ